MKTKNILRGVHIGALFTLFLAASSPLCASSIDVGQIRSALLRRKLDVSAVKIVSSEGIVILRGVVEDRVTYDALVPAVRNLGYARVANMVTVRPVRDNSDLRRAVERELSLNRALDGCQLQVTADRGRVLIRGTVQTERQIDAARAAARRVRGVRQVDTDLKNL